MRITMKTLSAHADGTLEIGKTYEVPGQCSQERADDLLDGGYAVRAEEDLAAADPAAAEPGGDGDTDKPLDKRTVEQLKDYAAEQNIDLGDAGKKAEILDRITTELARREAETED
jgi:hypothetical protein